MRQNLDVPGQIGDSSHFYISESLMPGPQSQKILILWSVVRPWDQYFLKECPKMILMYSQKQLIKSPDYTKGRTLS